MELFLIVIVCVAGAYLAASAAVAVFALNRSISRKGVAVQRKKINESGAPPSPYRSHTPEASAWWRAQSRQPLELTSFDGARLTGWALAAKKPTKKTALVMHGHDCDSDSIAFISRMFYEFGFNIVAPEMRANGESGGRCYSFGAFESEDALRWLERAIELFGPDAEIAVYGNSLGGGTACLLSAKPALPEQVKCIVSDCAFTSVKDEIKCQMQKLLPSPLCELPLALASLFCRVVYGFSFADARPIEAVKNARIPMFFVHGENDVFVPTDMSRRLYDACCAKKELYIVPGMQHGEAYFGDPAQYSAKVAAFCESSGI